jgi:NADPH-dependent 2,4-dienoyl-CoA reductase/sulfur reductase-like enzyme
VAKLETIAVVGASLAGLRAVETLRRRGFDGRLVLIGAERELPYDRPPLSKEVLRGDWDAERTALLRFDGLVIATGAAARRLPDVPDLEGIFTLRSLDDSLAIRAACEGSPRVLVVGAGFIGGEVAASCRARGLDVTLVEALSHPLGRAVGPEIGAVCAGLHVDHGVDLRCGVSVAKLEGARRVERVELSDGTRLEADLVIVGIGVTPETGWLEGSGLALDDGVVCDETCATRVPGIVAAGDVARWYNPLFGERMRVEHWMNASEQGPAAAERLLDANAAPFANVPFFWSDQFDAKIQSAGRMRPGDEMRIVEGSLEERRFVALYGRGGRLSGAVAFNRPRPLLRFRRRIGERISWEEALAEAG